MNLEISQRTVKEISEFARKYGAGEVVFEEMEISIPLKTFSITSFSLKGIAVQLLAFSHLGTISDSFSNMCSWRLKER